MRYIPLLMVMLWSIIQLMNKPKKALVVIMRNKLISTFILLSTISILWSIIPGDSLINVFKLIAISTFGLYIAIYYKEESFFELFLKFLFILIIVNAIVSVVVPSIGVHVESYHAGNWKGIMGHKNTLGTVALITYIAHWVKFSSSRSKVSLVSMLVSILILVKCGSVTALVLLTVIGSATVIYKLFAKSNQKSKLLLTSLLFFSLPVLMLLCFIFIENAERIMNLFGRDLTLTGRTNIWIASYSEIKNRMFIGHGFGGFWNDEYNVQNHIGFILTSSHSGILDLLMDVGVTGFIIVTMILFLGMKRAVKSLLANPGRPVSLFILFIFLFIGFNNITDSRLFNSIGLYWLMMVVAVLYTNKKYSMKYNQSA